MLNIPPELPKKVASAKMHPRAPSWLAGYLDSSPPSRPSKVACRLISDVGGILPRIIRGMILLWHRSAFSSVPNFRYHYRLGERKRCIDDRYGIWENASSKSGRVWIGNGKWDERTADSTYVNTTPQTASQLSIFSSRCANQHSWTESNH